MANLATISNNILADSGIDPIDLIVGTGTVDYIAKFTAEGAIGNSIMSQSGSNILINGNITLHAGNYNNYAPTLTGGGASGTWGINITGKSEQVTINYGDNTNANFYMLFGSGNSLFATGLIYLNPFTDTIYAAAYRGSANVDGTGEASYHPAGIYSGGTEWFYGTMYRNGSATYHANGSLYQVGLLELNNGFQIGQVGGTNYAQFNSWVFLPSYHGFYSGQNGAHFRPNDGTYGAWKIDGTRSGYGGIEFASGNGNITLMIDPTSNATGFHNNSYGWQFLWSNGSLYVYKNSYGGGSNSLVLDTSNYNSYAPTLTGGGASGTWGINITGSAGYASSAGNADTVDGYHASAFALVNGNTGQSFGVFELTYAQTQFNPSLGPRGGLNAMSIKMWDNYFAGIGLGADYGTVMEYYGRGGHVDTQVYFDAGGGSWYRSASYSSGWQSWQKYVTENSGTWSINISGASATTPLLTSSGSFLTQFGNGTIGYTYAIATGTTGLFPSSDNSNATLTINRHPGDYYSQLGFSSNGELYYRRFSAQAINTSLPWVTLLTSSNYNSYAPTLTGGGASGLWSINITGTAGSASSVAWSNVANKPANWLNEANLIYDNVPDTLVPSGFWQSFQGTGNPTGTWFNYINVRHSNTGNGHGYQIGMSYYDNNLWFRSYEGNGSFRAWSRALGTYTDPYPSNMNQYVRTTDAVTFAGANMTGAIVSNATNQNFTNFTARNTSSAGSMPNHLYYYIEARYNSGTNGTNVYHWVRDTWEYNITNNYHDITLGATYSGSSYVDLFRVSADGNIYATNSFRAPIFYDSQDTSYYLDPNSTSRLYYLNVPQGIVSIGNPWGTANSAFFPNGISTAGADNWIYGHTYIGNAPANGAGHEFWSDGNMRSTGYHKASIYYDDANTAYYLDPNNFSNLYSATFNSTVNFSSTTIWFGGYGPGSGPGMQFENVGSFLRMAFWGLDFYDWDYGIQMTLNNNYVSVNNYLQAGNSLRAPIFYDSNDTTFYLDPNSTSNLYKIRIGNGAEVPGLIGMGASYLYGMGVSGAYTAVHAHSSANGVALGYFDGTTFTSRFYVNNDGNAYAVSGMFAPIFYDSNDTSYYLNPTAGSRISTLTTEGRIYSNEWIQFSNYTGLYSPNNGAHFRPNSGSYGAWLVTGSRNGWSGIEFDSLSNGNVSLMVQTDSNTVGFHNNSYGWQIKWENGTLYVGKNSYGGGPATVLDSSNYTSYAMPYFVGAGSVDYNSNTTNGIYRNQGGANGPTSAHTTMFSAFQVDGNYGWQLSSGGSANIYFRYKSSVFEPWYRIYTNNDASASSTANTLALRDSVGDISAREFILTATFLHTSTPTALTGIYQTTNQVVRFGDTAVRNFLNVPTRTGGDASGTWGINITGSSNSSTYSTYLSSNNNSLSNAFVSWNTVGDTTNNIDSNYWYGMRVSHGDALSYYSFTINASFFTNGEVYYRRIQGGTSQGWVKFLDSVNYNSYAPTLTGTGASGTWGISITGSATNAVSLTTNYAGGQQLNPQVYFNGGIGVKVAMTAAAGYWSDTLWINGYNGGDVLSMCALHTQRNGTPRMYISTQNSNATSYGALYQFLTEYNWTDYAPTKTGTGASGTWGISITGSSNYVTHYSGRTDGTWYNAVWATGNPSHMYSCDAVQILSSAGALRANLYYGNQNTTYFLSPAGGSSYLRGRVSVTGGHGDSSLRVFLRADENGASTGQATLEMWVSEPGQSWAWAGFGYNVTNDNGSPGGFGRINTSFGQAYMRFSDGGDLYFYNTNTSGTRVQTASFGNGGSVTFGYSVTASSFFESSDMRIKELIEDNYKADGIESITARMYKKNGRIEVGYYAQDVQDILPSAVSVKEDGYLNLSYREVHTAKIAYLENKIKQLEEKLNSLY